MQGQIAHGEAELPMGSIPRKQLTHPLRAHDHEVRIGTVNADHSACHERYRH
jgi:hypothetical protein